jgi:hypothetical protein
MSHSEESNAHVRKSLLKKLAKRVGQELRHNNINADHGLSDLEEAVDEGDCAREDEAYEPGADRGARHVWVVMVVDYCADFSVW